MAHWTPDDIAWTVFDPTRLTPGLLAVVKAASLVERNAGDYTAYLANIFRDDADFVATAVQWRAEEVQHGDVLGRYAEMADPAFDFAGCFKRFTDGYKIPIDRDTSVRGSRSGELLARCIVETGTSSLYSALRDATDEPVLKTICHRIAGDEFRHYKTFYRRLKAYVAQEGIGRGALAWVAVGRIREADDDELAYAWHAANESPDIPYDRLRCSTAYAHAAFGVYRRPHAERVAAMVVKAIGFDPRGWIGRLAKSFAWSKIRQRGGQT